MAAVDGALIIDEPLALAPGTRIKLWQGCDKRLATCAGRFGNAFAFCVLLLLIVVSVMGAMSLLLRGRNDVRTQIGAGA